MSRIRFYYGPGWHSESPLLPSKMTNARATKVSNFIWHEYSILWWFWRVDGWAVRSRNASKLMLGVFGAGQQLSALRQTLCWVQCAPYASLVDNCVILNTHRRPIPSQLNMDREYSISHTFFRTINCPPITFWWQTVPLGYSYIVLIKNVERHETLRNNKKVSIFRSFQQKVSISFRMIEYFRNCNYFREFFTFCLRTMTERHSTLTHFTIRKKRKASVADADGATNPTGQVNRFLGNQFR